MSIELRWSDEQKLFTVAEFTPPWSWDAYHTAHAVTLPAMLGSVEHKVDYLCDMLALTDPPGPFEGMSTLVELPVWGHTQLGRIILMGSQVVIAGLYRIVHRTPAAVSLVTDLEQAMDIIAEEQMLRAFAGEQK